MQRELDLLRKDVTNNIHDFLVGNFKKNYPMGVIREDKSKWLWDAIYDKLTKGENIATIKEWGATIPLNKGILDDNSSNLIEDIKCILFDDRECDAFFQFETWVGDSHSFIIRDYDGLEYRVTVTREET